MVEPKIVIDGVNFIEINSENPCDYCTLKTNAEYHPDCDECDQYEKFSGIIAYQKINNLYQKEGG